MNGNIITNASLLILSRNFIEMVNTPMKISYPQLLPEDTNRPYFGYHMRYKSDLTVEEICNEKFPRTEIYFLDSKRKYNYKEI